MSDETSVSDTTEKVAKKRKSPSKKKGRVIYKITYFSSAKQKSCKKEFLKLKEGLAWVKAKGHRAYGVWKLMPEYSKS